MKKILFILVLLLPVFASAQIFQSMPQPGYGPVKRFWVDSTLIIPTNITTGNNLAGGREVGKIRYNIPDSSIQVWTGSQWVSATGGGGGGGVTANLPLTIDTGAININPADANNDGYLSAVDFDKFKKDSSHFRNVAGTISPKYTSFNLNLGSNASTAYRFNVNDGNVNFGNQINNVRFYKGNQLFYHGGTNTTDNSNNFLGVQSGNLTQTGSFNTAYGFLTGNGLTIGTDNTFVGVGAGYYVTGGSFNSLFGRNSHMNGGGSYNTRFGANPSNNGGTGSYNITLGYNAGVPIPNSSYQLNIGNWIFGRNKKITIGSSPADSSKLLNVVGTSNFTDTLFNSGNKYNGTSTALTMVVYDTLTKGYFHKPIPSGGGGGDISGTAAADQVVVGSGTNTVSSSSALKFNTTTGLIVNETNSVAATFQRNAANTAFTQIDIGQPTGYTPAGDALSLYAMGGFYSSTGIYQADGGAIVAGAGMSAGLNIATVHSSAPVKVWTNGNERMRIMPSGYVGVAITSPNSTLTANGSLALKYTASATNINLTDLHQTIELTATGITAYLPTAVGIQGRVYTIKLTASGTASVEAFEGEYIDGIYNYALSAQYKYVTVMSNNVGWIIISNN